MIISTTDKSLTVVTSCEPSKLYEPVGVELPRWLNRLDEFASGSQDYHRVSTIVSGGKAGRRTVSLMNARYLDVDSSSPAGYSMDIVKYTVLWS